MASTRSQQETQSPIVASQAQEEKETFDTLDTAIISDDDLWWKQFTQYFNYNIEEFQVLDPDYRQTREEKDNFPDCAYLIFSAFYHDMTVELHCHIRITSKSWVVTFVSLYKVLAPFTGDAIKQKQATYDLKEYNKNINQMVANKLIKKYMINTLNRRFGLCNS